VKGFRYEATVLDPPGLPEEVFENFRGILEAHGESDIRVRNEQGRIVVSFALDAESEREAMQAGSNITLSALSGFAEVRWVAGGVTFWVDEP
jgi:hypothetical protein